ncbi:MAG: hypothetical protein SVY41_03420 [Candidatus Nanohaloarchaea archaeon]|nr:hypothetical protein [Candidatus Nanohaloarchaea archaeon]
MRKAVSAAAALQFAAAAAAQDTAERPSWTLLVVTGVVLAALALYIYLRVQQHGLLAVLPQTAVQESEG